MATMSACVACSSSLGLSSVDRVGRLNQAGRSKNVTFAPLESAAGLRISHHRVRLSPRKDAPTRSLAATADFDQDTLVAVGVGLAGIAAGIAIPIFYTLQAESAGERDNDQPCFPCKGTGAQGCRFCEASGKVIVVLGGGETQTSTCVNCEGSGSITCTTCKGNGIQPRYLDRREFQDDD